MLKKNFIRIIPKSIRNKAKKIFRNIKYHNLRQDIMNFTKGKIGYEDVYKFLKENCIELFPHDFINKYDRYDTETIKVFNDKKNRKYVLYNGKKMYFKKSMQSEEIQEYIMGTIIEQDEESPHCYPLSDVQDKAIVADFGVAEGCWGLSIIDKVSKLYIFECDPEWCEALQLTFKPWKDKVEIINKYIDVKSGVDTVSVDDFFENIDLDYAKADIEGFEIPMLKGGKQTFTNKVSGCAICTYHTINAPHDIRSILVDYGFSTHYSKGYMLPFSDASMDTFREPYLREVLFIGKKNRA